MRLAGASVVIVAVLAAGLGSPAGSSSAAKGPGSRQTAAAERKAKPRTITKGLQVPWGLAFLPNGDALVSERTTGRILRITGPGHRRVGHKRVVMQVPGVDTDAGEGGLLGLAVSPHYRRDHWVYAYLTTASDNRIVRFRLGHTLHPVLTGLRRAEFHDGGRIAFGPDGKLYAGVGETGQTALAQDLSSLNGKILRLNPDGSVPAGNPFPNSLVWSWGHRNVQGLAWDRKGRLWATEFGQNTTDEVNLILPGHNYGWPIVEGVGNTQGGSFTNPVVTWTPTSTASPSGDAIVGRRLFVAGLRCECLFRIRLRGITAGNPVPLYAGVYGRLRSVVRAPDHSLWVTTSNRDGRGTPRPGDDRILRIPASG
jgi:glucose/arabinose dehydrogenase